MNRYILFDSRYYNDPDRATVYTVSETLKEACDDMEDFPDAVIVKFKNEKGTLTNPEIIEPNN